MTVPVDTLINLAIGQGLALAAARDIQTRQLPLLNPSFGYALGFSAACFAPLGMFLFWAYPDWSVMYLLGLSSHAAATLKWVVPWLYVAACAAGYAIAHGDLRSGHVARARALFVVTLVLEGAVSILGIQRLIHVGTNQQFRDGNAPWLWQDPLAPLLISIGGLFALSLAYLVTQLARRAPEA